MQEYVYNRLHFRWISSPWYYFIYHRFAALNGGSNSEFGGFVFSCFSYGWYFTFVQGFVYLCLIYLQGFTSKQMVNPWKTYVKLSAVLMGSHGLTKGSLAFLNYPAQIMFKSTKVCDKSTWKTQKKKPSYHYFTHFWRKHVCIS